MSVLGDPIDRMLEILGEMRGDRGPNWRPGQDFDRERRFLQIDDALRERLKEAGIDPMRLLFRQHPSAPRRWVLTLADRRQHPEHPPAEHAERGRPPLAGDTLTPRATDALPLSPSGYGALRRARADLAAAIRERDLARADSDRLENELAKALYERDAARSCERRITGTVDATIRRSLQALEQRDAARAKAIEWANSPIHRLLAAYSGAGGRATTLKIFHVVDDGREPWQPWRVSFDETFDDERFGMGVRRVVKRAPTLDEACAAAAEQIEAT